MQCAVMTAVKADSTVTLIEQSYNTYCIVTCYRALNNSLSSVNLKWLNIMTYQNECLKAVIHANHVACGLSF